MLDIIFLAVGILGFAALLIGLAIANDWLAETGLGISAAACAFVICDVIS